MLDDSPDAIVIAASPDLSENVVQRLAGRFGTAFATEIDMASAMANERPVIALLTSPATVLAALLAGGRSCDEACRDWQDWANSLLETRRRNRRRVRLVLAEAFERMATDLLSMSPPEPSPDLPASVDLPIPPIAAQTYAAALLATNEALAQIAAELVAEMEGGDVESPLTALIDAALCDIATQNHAFDTQSQEIERLKRVCSDAESRAKDAERRLDDASKSANDPSSHDIIRRQEEVMMLQASEIERYARALLEREQSDTTRLEQQRQERLKWDEAQGARNDSLAQIYWTSEQRLEELESRDMKIRALEAELERVYLSRSWRITGLLRATKSRFGTNDRQ